MDSAKVHLKRKEGMEPVTGFSYTDSSDPVKASSLSHMQLDPAEQEFAMTADQAAGAMETGHFELMESSKSQTKDKNDTQPLDE